MALSLLATMLSAQPSAAALACWTACRRNQIILGLDILAWDSSWIQGWSLQSLQSCQVKILEILFHIFKHSQDLLLTVWFIIGMLKPLFTASTFVNHHVTSLQFIPGPQSSNQSSCKGLNHLCIWETRLGLFLRDLIKRPYLGGNSRCLSNLLQLLEVLALGIVLDAALDGPQSKFCSLVASLCSLSGLNTCLQRIQKDYSQTSFCCNGRHDTLAFLLWHFNSNTQSMIPGLLYPFCSV